MRIFSISNTPHDTSQGSGYVITGYMQGLRKRGHDVDAYGPSDWRCIEVPRGRRYIYPLLIAIFGLRYCNPKEYDLIELWGGITWLLAVGLRLTNTDVPIVHHSNGIEQHRAKVQREAQNEHVQDHSWYQWDTSPLYDLGLHAVDSIVTVSLYELLFLKSRSYVPEERLLAISNPLPDLFLDRDVKYERPKRIGFCGGWIRRKAPSFFVKDIERFLYQYPSWNFSAVGVGETNISSEFSEDVRDRVEVIPFLEREALTDWYESLAVFVFPSIYESFGLVVAEAMACGAAVVTTNVGFASDLNHGREVIKVEEPQSPNLYGSVRELVENEPLRQRIARKGYSRVQELQWDTAVDRLERFYVDISESQ